MWKPACASGGRRRASVRTRIFPMEAEANSSVCHSLFCRLPWKGGRRGRRVPSLRSTDSCVTETKAKTSGTTPKRRRMARGTAPSRSAATWPKKQKMLGRIVINFYSGTESLFPPPFCRRPPELREGTEASERPPSPHFPRLKKRTRPLASFQATRASSPPKQSTFSPSE